MTSAAEAAADMQRAFSTSEEKLDVLREFATLCGIPANVVNSLTLLDFGDFYRAIRLWKNYFIKTNSLIDGYLASLASLESKTVQQEFFYMDLMVLKNTIILLESCNSEEKMREWVRGFSALDFVSTAMSDVSDEESPIRSQFFAGNLTVWHKIRGKMPWSDGSKITLFLGRVNHQIIKMARWARVEMDKQNDEVDDLLFQARLDNLREDPLKLTGIERLVQAFADEAARNFLAKLPAAGTKQCRVA
jgi:hypothetical protein